MDLKGVLKTIKLNESTISMILGILVLAVVGVTIVNYLRGDGGTPNLPNSSNNLEETTDSDSSKYTVAQGDSLWTVSEKVYGSGFEWQKIAEANNISAPYALETGQELVIPDTQVSSSQSPEETAIPAPVADTPTVDQANAISGESYTVVSGDNLWEIAVRAYGDGYKWVEIANANKLANPNIIHSGNVFTLPR